MSIQFLPFDRTALPPPVERLASPAVVARWRDVDRSASNPLLAVVTDADGEWLAAALVTARPHTAYLKMVDAVGTEAGIDAVVEAVVARARADGLVAVKWEGPHGGPDRGFVSLRAPSVSGPGTDFPIAGSVRWLVPEVVLHPVRYYRQITHYTCGAVTALSALAALPGADGQDVDADREMDFWKEATNHPACEPVGLGVALARRRPDLKVDIFLDTERPVILEHLDGEEQAWRADLQTESRHEAAGLGIPIASWRLSVAQISEAVGSGTQALLLLSLARMRGMAVPHWVRCCGTAGDALVIDDPAVDPLVGESWVDGHLLPVAAAELDLMAAYGSDGYRGVVFVAAGVAT
ncbi:peptidase C39 family protein [Kineosporia sp. NBRC 101731]|uniref:peptidase C39 family protein n=1 Tax=Kineosporia sp. NBRC 101731 TaxID=3032199 RepID=UPI0024A59591|nr:peptidase C39 family protein [Kineosporia sp. NBRC 101731]GLY28918.1 hypothetical protein Kisp02_22830 [Kineosporia sp. NBRC 101731]